MLTWFLRTIVTIKLQTNTTHYKPGMTHQIVPYYLSWKPSSFIIGKLILHVQVSVKIYWDRYYINRLYKLIPRQWRVIKENWLLRERAWLLWRLLAWLGREVRKGVPFSVHASTDVSFLSFFYKFLLMNFSSLLIDFFVEVLLLLVVYFYFFFE